MFSSDSGFSTSVRVSSYSKPPRPRAYTEAKHNRMCIVIAETSQPVKFLLPGCVPEAELNMRVVEEDVVDVVLEDSRLVHRWEIAGTSSELKKRGVHLFFSLSYIPAGENIQLL